MWNTCPELMAEIWNTLLQNGARIDGRDMEYMSRMVPEMWSTCPELMAEMWNPDPE